MDRKAPLSGNASANKVESDAKHVQVTTMQAIEEVMCP